MAPPQLPFPLPFPDLPLPDLRDLFRRPPPTPDPPRALSITPEQQERIVSIWSAAGRDTAALPVDRLSAISGETSATMQALRTTGTPARNCLDAISERLDAMTRILRQFNTEVAASDSESRAQFDALEPR